MSLQKLQNYLHEHQRVSLTELANHLHTDTEVLRPMLQILMRKGRVRKLEGKKCQGCSTCAPEAMEFYEWNTPAIHND